MCWKLSVEWFQNVVNWCHLFEWEKDTKHSEYYASLSLSLSRLHMYLLGNNHYALYRMTLAQVSLTFYTGPKSWQDKTSRRGPMPSKIISEFISHV